MSISLRWRMLIVAAVALLGLLYVFPSFAVFRDSPLGKLLPDSVINLGLDLKGGVHLTLGVDVDKALANSLTQTGEDIRTYAQEKEIPLSRPAVPDPSHLELTLLKPEKRDDLNTLLSQNFPNLKVEKTEGLDDGRVRYLFSLTPKYRADLINITVDQAVKTIRNRIDQFGVAEPDIRKQAGGRIQVQLPGLQDTQRAIQIIGKTAHLEFMLVDEETDPAKAQKGVLPPGRELSYMRNRNPDGTYREQPIVLKSGAVMTGEYIVDAKTNFDSTNNPYVALTFNATGAKLFERVTGENVKKRLAIVLDGKVYSAPVIQERIAGGRASITGRFSTDEARDLSIILRAGALPAPVNVLEERSVGPSLGQESIDKGVLSAVIGAALIAVCMALYYGFAGLVADLALILNIVLIMAGLAIFGATLTLPGIAGIILTMGMAVDANVLIFERIREELRLGLSARTSVDIGYSRASLTILDANVTTIIAAVVLYEFGTGPIRGFAVTLTLGIVASMFTAIIASRVLIDLWVQKRRQDLPLSI